MRIAIAGAGTIARDAHQPALTRHKDFTLVASADPRGGLAGTAQYETLEALLAACPQADAVAICTPPQIRGALAKQALQAGRHVLLEKPPCATVSEAEALVQAATACGRTLFFAWHSRYAPGVAPAAAWLAGQTIERAVMTWKEDARRWHPGQDWLWQPGGMGVFDPGINALSIASAIFPPFALRSAHLELPANCQAPIAAQLSAVFDGGGTLQAAFDFREVPEEIWEIRVETQGGGELLLAKGGHALHIGGEAVALPAVAEYASLYDHFAALIAAGESAADLRPLQLVADAFMLASRSETEPFIDDLRAAGMRDARPFLAGG